MDYESMLKKGMKELPESVKKKERFELPKVRGHIQGNRTIISNFYQVAETLGRKPEHVLKFILKELATPGELKKAALIFGSKVSATRINEKIEQYAARYVFCKECQRPDTKLTKEGNLTFIQCLACGARHVVTAKV